MRQDLGFGTNLKAHLDNRGMTQVQLAKDSGLTTTCINMIVSGKRQPNLVTAVRILRALDLRLEALVPSPSSTTNPPEDTL